LKVRKSANCSIRGSSAESTFSWWFHDCRLTAASRPGVGGEHAARDAVDELGEPLHVAAGHRSGS
jgi:hypothetical protein